MEEIIKKYLVDDEELYAKYMNAEKEYLKKLGDKYETIEIELDLDEKTIKKLFVSLAKSNICFDDLMLCILKEEIVMAEMKKL